MPEFPRLFSGSFTAGACMLVLFAGHADASRKPEETYPVKVNAMWFLKSLDHAHYPFKKTAPPGYTFCILDIEVKNNSSGSFAVVPWRFHLVCKDQHAIQGKWCYRIRSFQPQDLPPGTWSKGTVIFQIPIGRNYKIKELDRLSFEYAPSRYVNATLPKKSNVELLN